MAIEVFNRREIKYRLNEKTFTKLQNKLQELMIADTYNQDNLTYQICNIYYDTLDSSLIRTSLQKPRYKEKLRLRSYSTPNLDSKVFVEIKKKINHVVNKRRSTMELSEAYSFLSGNGLTEIKPYMNRQVVNELTYLLSQKPLQPMVYIAYERLAYFAKDNPDLRISFDTNILTRRHDLQLESGIYGTPLLPDGEWLMEIKTTGSLPLWLTHLLSESSVYPNSFSKYGTEYLTTIAKKQQPQRNYVMIFANAPLKQEKQTLAQIY